MNYMREDECFDKIYSSLSKTKNGLGPVIVVTNLIYPGEKK